MLGLNCSTRVANRRASLGNVVLLVAVLRMSVPRSSVGKPGDQSTSLPCEFEFFWWAQEFNCPESKYKFYACLQTNPKLALSYHLFLSFLNWRLNQIYQCSTTRQIWTCCLLHCHGLYGMNSKLAILSAAEVCPLPTFGVLGTWGYCWVVMSVVLVLVWAIRAWRSQ